MNYNSAFELEVSEGQTTSKGLLQATGPAPWDSCRPCGAESHLQVSIVVDKDENLWVDNVGGAPLASGPGVRTPAGDVVQLHEGCRPTQQHQLN